MTLARNGAHNGAGLHRLDAPTDCLDDGDAMSARGGNGSCSIELRRSLAEIKGQAQFLLYLADQIEESLEQLIDEADACHGAFLCKVLGMYSGQLESKHQGLGEKIAEACQEVYVTVREHEIS